jgi:8-oxo-dGTP diphosphatase
LEHTRGMNERPLTGIGIMVMRDGKVLLGKRKGSHAAGEYCFPGGYLEHGESFEDCARRETREEAGVEIENVRFIVLTHMKDYQKHHVQVGLVADWSKEEPRICEPEKCEGWGWYDLNAIPTPLFKASASLLEAYKTGIYYKDF